MKTFKPNTLTLALMLGGLSMASYSALGQEIEEQESATEESVEVIQIRGFRRSLIEAVNVKRFSDTIVEAVSADDMGALPDVSIADSITRLPGVTSVRQGGQSSELNIRGLSGNFVFATLNGRELVSNQGGRSVQFDQYPAELINSAQVYKSQKASLLEGGVAGTIELRTVNPLNNTKDHTFNVQGRVSYNDIASSHPDADAVGNRFSFSYQGKYLDDTLGVALGYARLDQPNISTQFINSQPQCGLLPYDGAPITSATDCSGLAVEGGAKRYIVPTSFNLNSRGGKELRDGFMGTLTYQPEGNLTVKTDVFYSKFDSERKDRGIFFDGLGSLLDGPVFEFTNPVLAGPNQDVIVGGHYWGDRNGTLTQAPLPGGRIPFGFQTTSDDRTVDSEVLSLGTNFNWDLDRMSVSLDLSHSEGSSIYLDTVVRMALFDNANAAFPLATNDFNVYYELNGLNLPTIELDSASAAGLSDPNRTMVTALEKYPNREENKATSIKLDLKYELDNDMFPVIEAGMRWAKRSHDFDRKMYRYGSSDFLGVRSGRWVTSWDLTDPDNPVIRQSHPPYQLQAGDYSVMNLGGRFSNYPNFMAIDNRQIEQAWLTSQGIDTTAGKSWDNSWTFFESNLVKEDTLAIYLQANLDTELAGKPLTGNVGVRVVRSKQNSTGLQAAVVPGSGDCITDDFNVTNCNYDSVKQGISYTDVLPSFNLNYRLTDDDQIRFAAAKVMARPDLPDMRVSGSWSFDLNPTTNQREANLNASSSPALKPFYAYQYDLSYEHYFTETEGAFVAALFYKDIRSIVQQFSQERFDFASANIAVPAVDPITQVPVVPGAYSAKFNNGEGGHIRGAELAYIQTFNFLPGPFKGMGFSGNISYTESELKNDFVAVQGGFAETSPLPGLSKVVWSAALFYDYEDLFSTRVNVRYRDDYIGNQVALGQSQQAFFKSELIVDFQTSYQFNENFQGVFSVSNLTDEPNISYFGAQYMTGTLQYFGRQYYLGVNARF